ncbi:hypothetical protein DPMN_031724 [Dreissena polymorpha]|uniref:Uncharacterized protein n=1 Tax=Dreissena polymorpha TaxID=45954 RepID=A0A9D4RHK6_DREPO|nr:hypothetical protein DPMN_031724 [Dreissena polymorpha]
MVECQPDLEGPRFNTHFGPGFFWLGYIYSKHRQFGVRETICINVIFQTLIETDRTEKQTDRHTDRQMDRQPKNRQQTDRYRHKNRQRDRQTDI